MRAFVEDRIPQQLEMQIETARTLSYQNQQRLVGASPLWRRSLSTQVLQWRHLNVGDIACVIIPGLAFFRIEVGGGILFATDFALFAAMPIVVARHLRDLSRGAIRTYLSLCVMWLLSQILTDIVRDSPFEDYSRGWLKILLTLTHFITIAVIIRKSRKRLILYGCGLALGGVLMLIVAPTRNAIEYPWKFGLAVPITTLGCLVAATMPRRYRVTPATFMVALAALNLWLGSRGTASVCLLAAIYSHLRSSELLSIRRIGKMQAVLMAVLLAAGSLGLFEVYSLGAESGWLGEIARAKYASESSGQGGILVGSRSEFLAAWVAIVDSPLLGHGSWAKDPKYSAILLERRAALGFQHVPYWNNTDLIPSHSHLFGAWVESGIVGAIFWCWVLWLTARSLARGFGREPLLPFFAFIGVTLLLEVMFSPYGAETRFTTTYYIYAMILLDRYARIERAKDCANNLWFTRDMHGLKSAQYARRRRCDRIEPRTVNEYRNRYYIA